MAKFGMSQLTRKYSPSGQLGGPLQSNSMSQPATPTVGQIPGAPGVPKQFQGLGAAGRSMLAPYVNFGGGGSMVPQSVPQPYDPAYLAQQQANQNIVQQRHETQTGLGEQALQALEPGRQMDYGMPEEYWASRERVQVSQITQQAQQMRDEAAKAKQRGMISGPEYDRRLQEIEMFERQGTGQARAAVSRERQEQAFGAQRAAAETMTTLYGSTPSQFAPQWQQPQQLQMQYIPPVQPSGVGGGGGYSVFGGSGGTQGALDDAAMRGQAVGAKNWNDVGRVAAERGMNEGALRQYIMSGKFPAKQ